MSWRGLRISRWKLSSWVLILNSSSDWRITSLKLIGQERQWSKTFLKPIKVWIHSKNNEKHAKLVWNSSKVNNVIRMSPFLSSDIQTTERFQFSKPLESEALILIIQNNKTDAYGSGKNSLALEHSNQLERVELHQAGFLI